MKFFLRLKKIKDSIYSLYHNESRSRMHFLELRKRLIKMYFQGQHAALLRSLQRRQELRVKETKILFSYSFSKPNYSTTTLGLSPTELATNTPYL